MKIRDLDGWTKFVYELLYPGILGSMIYDSSILLRGGYAIDWVYFTRVLIVILYILDYLHMSIDLKSKNIRKSGWMVFIDGLIPLAFAVAYWSLVRQDYNFLFIGLSIAFFLILIYPAHDTFDKEIYFLGRAIPFGISVWSIAVSQCPINFKVEN